MKLKILYMKEIHDNLDDEEIIKCNISSNEIILNIDFIANPNLNSTNPYLYKVTTNHIDSLNLNERYIQIIRKVS